VGRRAWQTHQITAGSTAAREATAFTAPRHSTATAEEQAAVAVCRRVGEDAPRIRTTGSRIHGTSAIVHASEEIAPRVVMIRGESANRTAATSRDARDPVPCGPSASSSFTVPAKASVSSSVHHRRWVSQSGSQESRAKNSPCGKR